MSGLIIILRLTVAPVLIGFFIQRWGLFTPHWELQNFEDSESEFAFRIFCSTRETTLALIIRRQANRTRWESRRNPLQQQFELTAAELLDTLTPSASKNSTKSDGRLIRLVL